MPSGSLVTMAADTGFEALRKAADPPRLEALFSGLLEQEGRVRLLWFEVLNHKPGRRCTVLYRIESGGRTFDLVGKWQRDLDQAGRLDETLRWAAAAGLRIPVQAGFDSSIGLVLSMLAAGTELRKLVTGSDASAFAAAGIWLAELHSKSPPDFLVEKTIQHELGKVEGWTGEVESKLPLLAGELTATKEALVRKAEELSGDTAVPVHRDFYPANLIWDGQEVCVLDFDQMAQGDPGVDLGAFLAQIDKLVIRDELDAASVAKLQDAFLAAYQARHGLDLEPRLPFFRAYTLLKLAAGEARRERTRWDHLTERFVRLALEQSQGRF